MQRLLVPLAAAACLVLGLGACGSSSKSSTPALGAVSTTTTTAPSRSVSTGSRGAASPAAITISNGSNGFAFSTSPVTAGTKVTVKNLSAAQHTVSADTAAGGFDLTIDAGKTATFIAPSKAGAYGFHCNIHTYMKGTLTVR